MVFRFLALASASLLARIAATACGGIIVVLSLLPKAEMVRTGASGPLEHVVANLAFGAALGLIAPSTRRFLTAALFLIGLAGSLEVAQTFSAGRTPNLIDFMASSIGGLIGVGAMFALKRIGDQRAAKFTGSR